MDIQSVVTNYASFLIEDIARTLANSDINDPDMLRLWRLIIEVLLVTFRHDQDGKDRIFQ